MEFIEFVGENDFEEFLRGHSESNFLQSGAWAITHSLANQQTIRSGVSRGGKLVSAWIGVIKDAKRGRYMEISGGPIVDWNDDAAVERTLREIKAQARLSNCVFARFRPQIYESEGILKVLSQNKARKAPMHLHAEHTSILTLDGSLDQLLSNMRRQTRYEIRRVAKRDVEITSRMPTEQDINEFYEIQEATAKRHGFVQSSRSFLQALRVGFDENLQIYRAEKGGELLNLALVIHGENESVYFEAASTPEARKEPGAYGIVWQAIQDAKEREAKRFNLWGIAYNDDPNHRYAGVTTFKRGFGGKDVAFTPAHDLVVDTIRYGADWVIETIRRKKRGL